MDATTLAATQQALLQSLSLAHGPAFHPIVFTAYALLGLIIVFALAALVMMWSNGGLWFFRGRSLESLTINTMSTWLAWSLVCAPIMVAYTWVTVQSTGEKGAEFPHQQLWVCIVWLPVWLSQWFVTWSVTISSVQTAGSANLVFYHIRKLNLGFIIFPILVVALMTTLCVLTDHAFTPITAATESLLSSISDALSTGDVDINALEEAELLLETTSNHYIKYWRPTWICWCIAYSITWIVFGVTLAWAFRSISNSNARSKRNTMLPESSIAAQDGVSFVFAKRTLAMTTSLVLLMGPCYLTMGVLLATMINQELQNGVLTEAFCLASIMIFPVFCLPVNFAVFLRTATLFGTGNSGRRAKVHSWPALNGLIVKVTTETAVHVEDGVDLVVIALKEADRQRAAMKKEALAMQKDAMY